MSNSADGVQLDFEVTETDLAPALGSGDVPVLATPQVLAWLEAATCAAAEPHLGPGQTSVGTRVLIDHVLATKVGGRVRARAEVVQVEGRSLTFAVRATDEAGRVIATGEVWRVVLDRERFLSKIFRS